MKTLEEIKEEYAIENGYNKCDSLLNFWMQEDIHECNNHINEISKRYAVEVAKQTQRNIADSADNDSIGKYIKMLALSESNLPNLNK